LCDIVFSTEESIDYTKSIRVQASDDRHLATFERDRLLLSLYKSLGHRPSALSDAGGLCATIVAKLMATVHNGVISRSAIVQTSIVALNRFDKLAAQHYQAMHNN
jgi:transcriptional regulator NrdR family protein